MYEGVGLLPTIALMVGSVLLAVHSALRVLPQFALIEPIGRHCPESVLRRALKAGGLRPDEAAGLAAELGLPPQGDDTQSWQRKSWLRTQRAARTRRVMQQLLDLKPSADAECDKSRSGRAGPRLGGGGKAPAAAASTPRSSQGGGLVAPAPPPAPRDGGYYLPQAGGNGTEDQVLAALLAGRGRGAASGGAAAAASDGVLVAPVREISSRVSFDHIKSANLPQLLGFLEDASRAHLGPGGEHRESPTEDEEAAAAARADAGSSDGSPVGAAEAGAPLRPAPLFAQPAEGRPTGSEIDVGMSSSDPALELPPPPPPIVTSVFRMGALPPPAAAEPQRPYLRQTSAPADMYGARDPLEPPPPQQQQQQQQQQVQWGGGAAAGPPARSSSMRSWQQPLRRWDEEGEGDGDDGDDDDEDDDDDEGLGDIVAPVDTEEVELNAISQWQQLRRQRSISASAAGAAADGAAAAAAPAPQPAPSTYQQQPISFQPRYGGGPPDSQPSAAGLDYGHGRSPGEENAALQLMSEMLRASLLKKARGGG
jgi:hypothetical protein